MHALPIAGRLHHAELSEIIEGLLPLAAELDAPQPGLSVRLVDAYDRIAGQVVPHMEQAETTLYPQLERLMQNRHSMTPMRREHVQARLLIDELGAMAGRDLTLATRLRLRRIIYRLYATLKIHLGEEEAYLGVLDHNLSAEEQDELVTAMEHSLV
ncbi:MAG TPA: hemerythrin domain-containing protein [Candidatus Limnocylindrales bacterium]|nr:hemerythrin domain-containing protein [Candidatus Limnocylindrales bacterium]